MFINRKPGSRSESGTSKDCWAPVNTGSTIRWPSHAKPGRAGRDVSQVASESFCESEFFLTPKATIPDVFNAVQSGASAALSCLLRTRQTDQSSTPWTCWQTSIHQYLDIYISGEVYLHTNQCLLVNWEGKLTALRIRVA